MEKKLGLSALTALVLSSMLGAGALAFYCWPLPC